MNRICNEAYRVHVINPQKYNIFAGLHIKRMQTDKVPLRAHFDR